MADVTAAVVCDYRKALRIPGIAFIVEEGPGAVERSRSKVSGIPAHAVHDTVITESAGLCGATLTRTRLSSRFIHLSGM